MDNLSYCIAYNIPKCRPKKFLVRVGLSLLDLLRYNKADGEQMEKMIKWLIETNGKNERGEL